MSDGSLDGLQGELRSCQPLFHIDTVHARLACAQIVVEARAIDTTSLERQLCVNNGGDAHPAIRRRAVIVKPQVDGVPVQIIRGGQPTRHSG
jgi:hypothetical protein